MGQGLRSQLFRKRNKTIKDITNKVADKVKVKKTFQDILKHVKDTYGTIYDKASMVSEAKKRLNADYLIHTNPHRDDWLNDETPYSWYRENCQRVCYAVDLQLSGHDVEALPNKRDDGAGKMAGENSYRNVYENAKWDDFRADSTDKYLSHIESLIPKSGDKCIIGCFWEGGGGHLFNAVNIGGKVYGVDGQVSSGSGNHFFNLNDYVQRFRTNSTMDVLVTSDMTYKATKLLKKFVKKRGTK